MSTKSQGLDLEPGEEVKRLFGRGTKTIFNLLAQCPYLGYGLGFHHALVHSQTHPFISDVIDGQVGGQRQIEGHQGAKEHFFVNHQLTDRLTQCTLNLLCCKRYLSFLLLIHTSLQLTHRLFKEACIEIKANSSNVAALLGAKQITRATDLEITHGYTKACTKLGRLLDCLQAGLGLCTHRCLLLVEQVGVGAVATAPYPSTQLVELGQSVVGCIVDNDGIRIRHIQSALDDGRTDQDIVPTLKEVEHDPFQFALAHLPMADSNTCIGE